MVMISNAVGWSHSTYMFRLDVSHNLKKKCNDVLSEVMSWYITTYYNINIHVSKLYISDVVQLQKSAS